MQRFRYSELLQVAMTTVLSVTLATTATSSYPTPQENNWMAHNFTFHTGETLPELRLHYTTVGASTAQPVLLLHGTASSGASFLTPSFAGELFGPGQPLDATKHYIILPDSLGAGKSSKPSDGLRAKFPRYNYDDMVKAQHLLVTEALGIRHLRLILGNSMGGMHTWLWGVTYPGFSDALVPMASQPTAMAGRNWMTRRLLIEMIRRDPAYHGGNYTVQPPSLALANAFFATATNGGTLAYQAMAPTRELADRLVDSRLAAPCTADANDFTYQWDAARDYDPAAGLAGIQGPVLAINSADDERNPPETGILAEALKEMPRARLFLIPASADTRGHSTTSDATFWKRKFGEFFEGLPASAAQNQF